MRRSDMEPYRSVYMYLRTLGREFSSADVAEAFPELTAGQRISVTRILREEGRIVRTSNHDKRFRVMYRVV